MNKYLSSAELKSLAKDKLSGKYSTAILAMVIVTALPSLISSLIPTDGYVWSVLYFIVSIIVYVLMGILQIGLSYMFLNMACNRPYSSADIYYGFHNHSDKAIKIACVQAAISTIPLLPYQIFMMFFISTQETIWFMLTMVFLALGLLIYVPLSLAFSQSYYLFLDFPDYSATQILKTSCKLMKGHMGRLFYIQASFIPLMFLGTISFMIGMLWVMPYMEMTLTLFFLDLMNPLKKDSE